MIHHLFEPNLDGSFCFINFRWFINFRYSIIVYYYINLRSLITFCLCSGDIYLSLCISLSSSMILSKLFCGQDFESFLILSAILFPIKSPVVSTDFWIALFEAVLSASVENCLTLSIRFWLYLLFRSCACYIFACLIFKSKREKLWNLEKCFLFHFKSSFHFRKNQILEF